MRGTCQSDPERIMAEDNSDELIREFYGIDLAGLARC
jgi:hypothetical protein